MSDIPAGYDAHVLEGMILILRGQKVILDTDLARIYGVPTKALNQAVKRNASRFPQDFAFQLTVQEASHLRSQFVTLNSAGLNRSQIVTGSQKHRDPRHRPYAFTEHGAMMTANVLNSRQAVKMSVFVVRAFVRMREKLTANQVLEKRLAEIEKKLLLHDASLRDLYERIRPLLLPPPEKPKRKIGYTAEEKRAVYRA